MINKIIGSIHKLSMEEQSEYHIEKVYVKNEDLAKRLLHLVSDHNRNISVLLDKGNHLHVGDILEKTEKNLLIVDVLNEDVLVIHPNSMRQMGVIAHNLGNRHLPAQFIEDTMIIQYDTVAETYLLENKFTYQRENRRLETPFRYIGHRHD
ncbi:MAG: urease accessory protein UreE [Bacillus sp. (in: firmicutes)]